MCVREREARRRGSILLHHRGGSNRIAISHALALPSSTLRGSHLEHHLDLASVVGLLQTVCVERCCLTNSAANKSSAQSARAPVQQPKRHCFAPGGAGGRGVLGVRRRGALAQTAVGSDSMACFTRVVAYMHALNSKAFLVDVYTLYFSGRGGRAALRAQHSGSTQPRRQAGGLDEPTRFAPPLPTQVPSTQRRIGGALCAFALAAAAAGRRVGISVGVGVSSRRVPLITAARVPWTAPT